MNHTWFGSSLRGLWPQSRHRGPDTGAIRSPSFANSAAVVVVIVCTVVSPVRVVSRGKAGESVSLKPHCFGDVIGHGHHSGALVAGIAPDALNVLGRLN